MDLDLESRKLAIKTFYFESLCALPVDPNTPERIELENRFCVTDNGRKFSVAWGYPIDFQCTEIIAGAREPRFYAQVEMPGFAGKPGATTQLAKAIVGAIKWGEARDFFINKHLGPNDLSLREKIDFAAKTWKMFFSFRFMKYFRLLVPNETTDAAAYFVNFGTVTNAQGKSMILFTQMKPKTPDETKAITEEFGFVPLYFPSPEARTEFGERVKAVVESQLHRNHVWQDKMKWLRFAIVSALYSKDCWESFVDEMDSLLHSNYGDDDESDDDI